MRLLNVSKEKALSLMTAIIYILPKQTFAHHCLLDILIKKKKKVYTHTKVCMPLMLTQKRKLYQPGPILLHDYLKNTADP